MRILLIEDSLSLADTLKLALQAEHYTVDLAHDGNYGYECASSGIYDAIILDLMLPEMNGYDILRALRGEKNDIPIMVLSAKSQLDDKVLAFEYGADDYLTKPFETKELMMRLKAITRRRGEVEASILSCGNLHLNLDNCEISNPESGKSVILGGKEFQLMEYLLLNKNQIIKKEQIIQKIWGYDTNVEYNNVEVYVSFLRKKIKYVKANVRIRVVRGVGYTMEVDNDT